MGPHMENDRDPRLMSALMRRGFSARRLAARLKLAACVPLIATIVYLHHRNISCYDGPQWYVGAGILLLAILVLLWGMTINELRQQRRDGHISCVVCHAAIGLLLAFAIPLLYMLMAMGIAMACL